MQPIMTATNEGEATVRSVAVVHAPESVEIPISQVIFRQDLYPRLETSAATVQRYAEELSVLPAIEVNQHHELIDGWHRWTAHKKTGVEMILCVVTNTASDAELLELSIERNAKHGMQLSVDDKESAAIKIWLETPPSEREKKEAHLCKLLSVGPRQLARFLSRTKKESKERARKNVFDLWLACYTQEEIADKLGLQQQTISGWLDGLTDFGQMSESSKVAAEHATDFDRPLYNVWKQQQKTPGSEHFGNSESRWVDNLLYLYTRPFDMVIDPFAGGGSTIDICRKRFRRYWVSDRKPPVEREHQIRVHDLTTGLPKFPRWQDVKLVYLDPPYWKQAEGRYSDDPTDLANMSLEEFTETLVIIINGFAKKLKPSAFIALLLQPTQWKAENHEYTDHVADMIRAIKLPIDLRVQCPYESQQCTAQMADWAKQNRKVLVLSRELIIWRI